MVNAWKLISREPKDVLNDNIIMRFSKYINWIIRSSHYDFNEDMLRMYQHRGDWCRILKRKQFSEAFVRENVLNFNECWGVISKFQVLSEQFINDYADKLDWDFILSHQKVSDKFIADHEEYIYEE